MLARDCTVYTIDGPSHGKSETVRRDFTFEELVAAAEQALDRLGLTEPVDWIGNAWGGHIGIRLATGSRLKTLTSIGTPVQGFNLREKLTMAWPLVTSYRFAGPNRFIMKQLFDSLLGAESIAAQPDHADVIKASFREADRKGMFHAMRSMMLHRTGIEDLLSSIKVPTLVMPVRDDVTGWRPDEARRTCAAIPDCRVEEVAGTGHISPLLIDRDRIARLVTEFWTDHHAETEDRVANRDN
jgi:pimeloyl-ACP methyl ester carboxylesterase